MPPISVGGSQVSATSEALVIAALFFSELGGFGFVVITAPYPASEAFELPTAFVAITVANILSPHARL